MKKIVFTRADGGVSVMGPCEGARLAYSVTFSDASKLSSEDARPVDTFLRRWPVEGASVAWAETIEDFYARIIAKDVPKDAANVRLVDESELPIDRFFRDAWQINVDGVAVNMPAAREIYRQQLRQVRAPILASLDIAFIRSLETGDTAEQARIIAKKQALRSVTDDPAIDAAQTPEELKAVMPEALL